MSFMAIRIAGVIIGGTLGGYISGKIGGYIYNKNKNKKIPEIENSIEINQIPVSSSDDKKNINSFEDLLNEEIKIQPEQKLIVEHNNINTEQNDLDNYFKNYLKALENEKKIQQEKEMLFINDALYDNDYYDYILLVAK